jgi:hypothetical protein
MARRMSAADHTLRNSDYPNPSREASCLLFVRLAYDRRFLGAVLFVFVVCLFVLIRISRRHRVADDYEGAPVDGGLWRRPGRAVSHRRA